jgi:hypothetical protein
MTRKINLNWETALPKRLYELLHNKVCLGISSRGVKPRKYPDLYFTNIFKCEEE